MFVSSVRRDEKDLRGGAAPADVRCALPVVASPRGRVPSPRVMNAAGGRAPARAVRPGVLPRRGIFVSTRVHGGVASAEWAEVRDH